MTWIVGASSLFGYGVVISDVQVTLHDGKTIDIIQKAYPLSNYIIGGFAGSVMIGFMLLQNLATILQVPSGQESYAWDPVEIANYWSPIARDIFASAPLEERKLRSQFLLVGASPDPIKRGQPIGWDSEIYIIRFSSPEFTPRVMVKRNKICTIGSGSQVDKYKQLLREIHRSGIRSPLYTIEARNPHGWGKNLAFHLSRHINENPYPGISKHLHVFTVTRGEILLHNNDYKMYPKDGSIIDIKMPDVAKTYSEFESMIQKIGSQAAGAIC